MSFVDARTRGTVHVERWPSELPLQALCILASLGIYALLVISVIGIFYALAFVFFLFLANAALVAFVRGSAVRLGLQQFPELHRRVEEIAQRFGLDDVPDAYLMQAGGALNAFATRLLGLNVIVLYTGLLEACGDNEAARDMIIAHELGHVKAGHLRLRWLIAPAMAVPLHFAIVGTLGLVVVGGGVYAALKVPRFMREVQRQSEIQRQRQAPYQQAPPDTIVGSGAPPQDGR